MRVLERVSAPFRPSTTTRASALTVDERAAVQRALRIAAQKVSAAATLRVQGSPAEAIVLCREALAHVERAVERTDAPPPVERDLERARRCVAAAAFVELDEDVRSEHEDALAELIAAERRSIDRLREVALDDAARTRVQRTRVAIVLALVAVACAFAVWAARRPPQLWATASAMFDAHFNPELAIDRQPSTEWLLPDRTAGFLDVSPARPTKLKLVRILNAKNPGGPNRATNEFRIEVFADGQVVRTIDGDLGPYSAAPAWRSVELGVSQPIQKLRFHVKSWHGQGGGLAEIALE